MNLADCPKPLKFAFSLFISCIVLGLLQAHLYLKLEVEKGDTSFFPSTKKIQDHFFVEKIPILRKAIDTNMSQYVESPEDRELFYRFMEEKAPRELYEKELKPVLEYSCLECHSEGGEAYNDDFSTYEGISQKAIFSYQPYLKKRLKIAHPHMLTIPLFLLPLSLAIWFTPLGEKTRGILMSMPFCGVIIDISSWFLTMFYKQGAWLVLLGGTLTALGTITNLMVLCYFLWIARRKIS